jgi:hypothetical protein
MTRHVTRSSLMLGLEAFAGRLLVSVWLSVGPSCAATLNLDGKRPPVLRDVEGYVIASCLAQQSEPYLKDQGDGWASVVIQRGASTGLFAPNLARYRRASARAECSRRR